jgi:hypothetical protein
MRTAIAVLFLLTTTTVHAQFGAYTFNATDSQSGAINGFMAFVDATMTNVSPIATSELSPTDPCRVQGFPVRLTTTIQFAADLHAPFAINANLGPGMSDAIYDTRPCGTPYGLLKNAGHYLAAVDQLGTMRTYGPSLIFPKKGALPMIGPNDPLHSVNGRTAIAGWIGGQGCTTQPGTPLVVGGVNHGLTAQPVPTTPAPRTGVGIDATGAVLICIVVNGIEGSQGLTLPDFADLFLAFGAKNAINLDGGGSSTFAWNPAAVVNHTSQRVQTAVDNVQSAYGSISKVTLQNTTSSPCYSYPHALPGGCQPSPVHDPQHPYRPIYANFGYIVATSGTVKQRTDTNRPRRHRYVPHQPSR